VLAGAFAIGGTPRKPLAVGMFCLGAFAIVTVAQELVLGARARRAMTGEPPPVAMASLIRRNRRRYGGYVVHVGMAVLLVGVAASSTFQHVRDVRLRPGQATRVGAYDIRYVRQSSALGREKITLGAVLDVSKRGRHVATLRPSRGYYPSIDQSSLGRIGRFFNGDSTSELGLRAGPWGDIWTAVQPDISSLQPALTRANRSFPDANPRLEGFLVSTLVGRYQKASPPAEFRMIVSPLVGWIWIGGSIIVGGALLGLWPAPRTLRRRVSAPAPAGLGPERAGGPAALPPA
jgi:cytochrome c-type biogenesis protein CcmF